MNKLDLILRTNYPTEVCAAKLIEEIDDPQHTLFSFSGYRGKKPVLGFVSGQEFCLFKRRYGRNDFAPYLYGRILADGRSSRVEAYWGMQRWSRTFMRIWLAIVALIGTPIFLASLYQLLTGKPVVQGDLYVGLLVPPGLVLFGILLPKFGTLLGLPERAY